MKKQFFVANWKSHKTTIEAKEWLEEYQISNIQYPISNGQEIILCPPFPLLQICHDSIKKNNLAISLGSQDISAFPEGPYTGEVSGKLLREFGSYTIIGHSETRKYYKETKDDLVKKVASALSYGITPIYCLSEKQEKIPKGVTIVAFEPLAAIGSGNPNDPEETDAVARFITQKNDVSYVLYGGSVTKENVAHYTSLASIHGVLVGGASLSPSEFTSIIQNA